MPREDGIRIERESTYSEAKLSAQMLRLCGKQVESSAESNHTDIGS